MGKENSKGKNIPVFLGIASVWFGAHAGPGVASGKQTAVYFSEFGKWGFIAPFIAMGLMALCVYYSIEYSRLTGITNFKDLTDSLFDPYQKVFSTFFELTFIATVLMVVGGCIATGASILKEAFNIPILAGTFGLVVITILLSMYGDNLVRASSTVMTLFIIFTLLTIVVVGLSSPLSEFKEHWNTTSFSDHSFLNAAIMAVVYTGFQSAGNIANTIAVAGGLKSNKESKKAAFTGFILNSLLIIVVAFLLFGYPEAIPTEMPNFTVVEKLGFPILSLAYTILVLLAVLSTTVSFSFSVVARYGDFLPMEPGKKRDFVMVLILLALTVAVSFLGLDAIVSKGYKYLGYACIPIVIIPIIGVGSYKVKKLTAEQVNE